MSTKKQETSWPILKDNVRECAVSLQLVVAHLVPLFDSHFPRGHQQHMSVEGSQRIEAARAVLERASAAITKLERD